MSDYPTPGPPPSPGPSGPPRHPRPSEPTPYDRWRQDAYLRVTALRAAVEHYSSSRPVVGADFVLSTAAAFHDFLTEGQEDAQ